MSSLSAHDLIAVRDFPAVVQAADVRTLRTSRDSSDVANFVGGYLGYDEHSRYALETAVRSLAQQQRGGAFFLNGVFGSGKSHLLGVLALLSEGIGHEAFAATHPQLAPLLPQFSQRLVVHLALDEFDPAQFSLEEIVAREIKSEFQRRFGTDVDLPEKATRPEYFAALDEALLAQETSGVVICIDELSLFLSAKDHRGLQADAGFLQFLGQRAARSTSGTLHIFAALQKTVEDIGDLEAYSLSQIRDRFQTLQLATAHIPSLISHRLIVHKNPEALHKLCHDGYESALAAFPRLEFGRQEWETLYPFHPATVMLLEQVVARFFSRTRSAALFAGTLLTNSLKKSATSWREYFPMRYSIISWRNFRLTRTCARWMRCGRRGSATPPNSQLTPKKRVC